MRSAQIPSSLREAVRFRARRCCEYCGVHEGDANFPHEPDHVIAVQHRGQTQIENLAFACFHCNRLKGPNLSSIDPHSAEIVRLFNPRRDHWAEHFCHEQARIIPVTAIGRATADLLQFNSEVRLAIREALWLAGRYPI